MFKKRILFLAIIIPSLAITYWVYVSSGGSVDSAKKTVTDGFITGTVLYPDEVEAALLVCAQDARTGQQVSCTEASLPSDSGSRPAPYRLEVAPGTYFVYAADQGNPDTKAYYTEYVTCGMGPACASHLPIPVEVNSRETVSDVNTMDWPTKNR